MFNLLANQARTFHVRDDTNQLVECIQHVPHHVAVGFPFSSPYFPGWNAGIVCNVAGNAGSFRFRVANRVHYAGPLNNGRAVSKYRGRLETTSKLRRIFRYIRPESELHNSNGIRNQPRTWSNNNVSVYSENIPIERRRLAILLGSSTKNSRSWYFFFAHVSVAREDNDVVRVQQSSKMRSCMRRTANESAFTRKRGVLVCHNARSARETQGKSGSKKRKKKRKKREREREREEKKRRRTLCS